jgi:hypothetical protein
MSSYGYLHVTYTGAVHDVLDASASGVSQSSVLDSGCIKSVSETSIPSPVMSCGRSSVTSNEQSSQLCRSRLKSVPTVSSESSSDVSITSSAMSFQSATDFSNQHATVLPGTDAGVESVSASVSGLDLRHTDELQNGNGLGVDQFEDPGETHLADHSSYDDDIESFYSPLPEDIRERPDSVNTINEFTLAAERWRMHERMVNASSQTPVLMTVNACVGTASKIYVDASTNTESLSACPAVDFGTNTDKQNFPSARDNKWSATGGDVAGGQNVDSSGESDPGGTVFYMPSTRSASTSKELDAVDPLSARSGKHNHFLDFGAAMAGSSHSAVHECPLSTPSSLNRVLSWGLDGYESSEESICSNERESTTTRSVCDTSIRQPPPGLEHFKVTNYLRAVDNCV